MATVVLKPNGALLGGSNRTKQRTPITRTCSLASLWHILSMLPGRLWLAHGSGQERKKPVFTNPCGRCSLFCSGCLHSGLCPCTAS